MIIFTPNTVIKSADVNLNFTEALKTSNHVNPYKFHAYRNAAWTATSGLSKVDFDAEVFDTNNNFASGTYTVPLTGFYQFNATVTLAGNTTRIFVSIYKNAGATELARNDTNISNAVALAFSCNVSCYVKLTAGETVDVRQASANVAGAVAPHFTYFSGFLESTA